MSEIKINIDKSNLNCVIELSKLDTIKINEIRFQLMNRWDTIEFHPSLIEVPYYQLKRSLPYIGKWCRLNGIKIEFDDFLQELIQRFAHDRRGYKGAIYGFFKALPIIQQTLDSSDFNRKLTTRQTEDVNKLIELYHGANFSVPGAGKTTSLLAVHSILKSLGIVSKMLVICPINAFISWENEVKDIYGDTMTLFRLNKNLIENYVHDSFPSADIYITNYEKFRGGIEGLTSIFVQEKMHLVLDESHRIKSGFSNQSYPQIIQLGDCSTRRDIMSGTPMPQSYSDIKSQFEFLWPTETFVPENIKDVNIPQIIHSRIKNFYVRTKKKDLELEPVVYLSTEIDMGPIQRELYNLLRSESARAIAKMERESLNTFRFLGRCVVRLMQASANPMLLTSNEDIYDEIEGVPDDSEVWQLLEEYGKYERPAKFIKLEERVKQILQTNSEAKILVWSIFVKNILLLEKMFQPFNPAIIYGGVSSSGDETIEESREGQIRKFHNDPTCRIMIANPQACGEGISLHRVCHHAIYLERNYNAAHYLQSMDRIHRYGLKPGTETKIELLIAKNSLDQRIDQRLREKIAAMSVVLDDEFLHTMAYDPYDVGDDSIGGLDSNDLADVRSYFLEGQ